jgi:hypothetical protein
MKYQDRVCTQLHFSICEQAGVNVERGRQYEPTPKPVETSQDNQVTVLCNQQIITDRTTPCNKPVIILRRRKGKGTLTGIPIRGL